MKRSRFIVSALTAGAVATVGLAGCTTSGGDDSGESSIRIAVTALGAQYDPGQGAYMYSSLNVNAVYDSLLIQNDEAGFDPWLATDWEQSDDRKTLSFTLRDDVDFSDGTHLDAAAVVEYFQLEQETETFPQFAKFEAFGATFEATGEYTFEVTTEKPMDYDFIYGIVATTPIASPEAAQDPDSLTETPVGTGPYVIDEQVPDVSATFARNDDYWNPDAFPFDTVELRVFEDDVAALNAIKGGQIDAAALSIPNAVEAENEGFNVDEAPGRFVALWFADRGGTLQPAIADVRVRQAINYALDREAINEAVNLGHGVVSSQPFSPFYPEYVDGGDDYYAYDLDRAKQLMADAGYEAGFDLTIPSTTFLGINENGPAVQQALSEIGIRVTFDEIGDVTTYFERARDGSYPVLMYNEAYVNTLGGYLAPDAFWNYLGYVDPKEADLYDTIRNGTLDESEAASKELGQYVLEQAWLAPFSSPQNPWASVDGVTVDVAAGNSGAPYLVNFGVE